MKRLLAVLPLGLAIAACGTHSGKLQSATTNHMVQKDQKAAEQIVQGCLSKGNFFTQPGRKAITTCLAPAGHQAALQKCVAGDASQNSIVTHRKAFYQGLAVCVEQNR